MAQSSKFCFNHYHFSPDKLIIKNLSMQFKTITVSDRRVSQKCDHIMIEEHNLCISNTILIDIM